MASENSITYVFLYIMGFGLRIMILHPHFGTDLLGDRVEIATPLTSWKRAIEGVSLKNQGINPYDGDIFHESPLALAFYDYILKKDKRWIPFIFAFSDMLTASILCLVAQVYLNELSKKEADPSKFPPKADQLLLKSSAIDSIPLYISFVYIFGPYSVVSCGGKSTSVFFNTVLSFFLLFTVVDLWHLAATFLAALSYHSFYYVNLLVPLLMLIHQKSNDKEKSLGTVEIVSTTIVFCFTFTFLIFLSLEETQSWNFLWSTYGCILSVPDLTPNIGLFWYFFTEMFEHFRVFFLCTFQLNVFVYTVPLAIRFRKEPIFFLFIQLIIIAIFKSYPSVGDVAFYFALLPMWSHLFHFMRQRFIVICGLASCTLLAPTLWYLWIYSGSANANFYFAITLVFNTAQVFLLTDLLSAYIKREYYLENGVKYNKDGSLVLMRLM